uniref:Uncharacterized protein n=1 Tax=Clandestinovirus TaxID=2831644 RepID=A0A8F8KP91_9VIRU|nr:hypothetical protein KOM_12_10 [Clandestinovirus]
MEKLANIIYDSSVFHITMSNPNGIDLAKVEEIFSHPYNVYGAPYMPPQPYDCGQPGLIADATQQYSVPMLNQETTQYVTIRPKTTSSVTIRPPIDRTRTADTSTSSSQITSRSYSGGSGNTYDHYDDDDDHDHHHHRRRRWWGPNYYYVPNPWVDSYYPTYPYDPAMNNTVREALLYKCMWDGDGNPGLCDHVFATEAFLSTPWYKPWAWDWRYPIRGWW